MYTDKINTLKFEIWQVFFTNGAKIRGLYFLALKKILFTILPCFSSRRFTTWQYKSFFKEKYIVMLKQREEKDEEGEERIANTVEPV